MFDFHALGIDLKGHTSGKLKAFCPACHDLRHDKSDKSLYVNIDEGWAKCFYCGKYFKAVDHEAEQRKKLFLQKTSNQVPSHFRRPRYDVTKCTLMPRVEEYLVKVRCLSQEVIRQLKLGSSRMKYDGLEEEWIHFPYLVDGEVVNVKYRSLNKHFRMEQGAEMVPYNIDAIRDAQECVITEGEIDCASYLTAGYPAVISVPSGANRNLSWLDRFVETHFANKTCIYIATDTDRKGLAVRSELAHRLGVERCKMVTYGPNCKDANEHLLAYGAESLLITLTTAKELPLEGAVTMKDLREEFRVLYETGLRSGAEAGWEYFDELCTFELGRLAVMTGVPGHGKSEWLDELCMRLCVRHDWKVAYFSPENQPIGLHLIKLAEKLSGRKFMQQDHLISEELYDRTVNFMEEHVTHILSDDKEPTLEWILEKGRELVVRRGVRVLVIDPMNCLDMDLKVGETEVMYYRRALNAMRRFAQKNRCLVFLVAHPRKMNRDAVSGTSRHVEMYDIMGSADFVNKPDYIFSIERKKDNNLVNLYVEKVKFKHLGHPGVCHFVYNAVNGRYSPTILNDMKEPTCTKYDNDCWVPKPQPPETPDLFEK